MQPELRPRGIIGTYAPVLLIAVSVLALGVGSWFLIAESLTTGVLWAAMLPAGAAAVITARRSRAVAEREWRLRSAIEADKLRLEEEQAAWAVRRSEEQRRLEGLESSLVDRAAAAAWWPAPPDPKPIEPDLLRRDEDVDRLIDASTDRVFEALREGKYVRNDRFESPLFWQDVGALVRDVAAIYQPGGDKAWLETDVRQLALAVHRAALRVSLRLEQLPGAPSSRKMADIVKWTETYRSGQGLLDYAKPLMNYVPWMYRLVRVLAGANPATLGLSVILYELVKKAGFHISVEVLERYFKNLVREFLTAVAQEAANVYGGGYGRRTKAWVLGAEAVHLARQASQSRAMLSAVVRLLDELDLRDEVDRRALLRGLVAPTFDPVKTDWLPIADRTEVLERIEALFEAQPSAMEAADLARWKAGLEARLGHRSRLEIGGGTVHDQAQLQSIATSLASWGLGRGTEVVPLRSALLQARALQEMEESARAALVASVLAEPGPAGAPLPRFDLTEPRRQAFVEDLLSLMSDLRPWGPSPDFDYLEEVGRRFRLDAAKLRTRLGAGYADALSRQLESLSPLKKLPPGAAYAALVGLEDDEQWGFAEEVKRLVIPADAGQDDKKALRSYQRELGRGASLWLLISARRAIVLRKAEVQAVSASSSQVLWEGRFSDRTVRVERVKSLTRRFAELFGGRWALPQEIPVLAGLGWEIGRGSGDRLAEALDPTTAPD